MLALCALATTWYFALQVLVNPHTDLRELLPRDSPGLKAFEHQLGRVGGGATLIVVAESPDRAQNERFIDDLSARLDAMAAEPATPGRPNLVSYVESGTRDVHEFFDDHKWLYATEKDLESAYDTLDFQIAVRSGLVQDLSDDEDDRPAPRGAAAARGRKDEEPALGLDAYADRWKEGAREHDDFPSGYFETPDGTMIGLRIVSSTTGMGDAGGDRLLQRVERLVKEMHPESYQPQMKVGPGGGHRERSGGEGVHRQRGGLGDRPRVSSRSSPGSSWFFRSAWSLAIIGLPALLGVGAAYAFAYFRFGYVNTTGMFLGAIILGNGINYPIVLLSRYREFRARGQDAARRAARGGRRTPFARSSSGRASPRSRTDR